MQNIEELSKVGFGCYRLTHKTDEHYDALLEAIQLGCNLLDTASSYTNGSSELLIGKVLKKHDLFKKVFLISKAGYIQGNDLRKIKTLNKKGLLNNDVVNVSKKLKHSIHPDFLDYQLTASINRLCVSRLDCFLLHNPEYYYKDDTTDANTASYYDRIKKSFEFLEEQVHKGRIRYYGVSSNTFPLSCFNPDATNIAELLRIASEVSSHNHFKFIQFPFNFFEKHALDGTPENLSLLEIAKQNSIISLSNRPLNSKVGSDVVRFATYDELSELNADKDVLLLNNCLAIVEKQFKSIGLNSKLDDIPVINILKKNWKSIGNPEAVNLIFVEYFYPFINEIFNSEIPLQYKRCFKEFEEVCEKYSKRQLSIKANKIIVDLIAEGIIKSNDTRPLPVIACEYYLNSGINHVLIGMKNPKYVKQLSSLF